METVTTVTDAHSLTMRSLGRGAGTRRRTRGGPQAEARTGSPGTDRIADTLSAIVGAAFVARDPVGLAAHRVTAPTRCLVLPATVAELADVRAACARAGLRDAAIAEAHQDTRAPLSAPVPTADVLISRARMRHVGPVDTVGRVVTAAAGAPLGEVAAAARAAELALPFRLSEPQRVCAGDVLAGSFFADGPYGRCEVRDRVVGACLVTPGGRSVRVNRAMAYAGGCDVFGFLTRLEREGARVAEVSFELVAPAPEPDRALFAFSSPELAALAIAGLLDQARGASSALVGATVFAPPAVRKARALCPELLPAEYEAVAALSWPLSELAPDAARPTLIDPMINGGGRHLRGDRRDVEAAYDALQAGLDLTAASRFRDRTARIALGLPRGRVSECLAALGELESRHGVLMGARASMLDGLVEVAIRIDEHRGTARGPAMADAVMASVFDLAAVAEALNGELITVPDAFDVDTRSSMEEMIIQTLLPAVVSALDRETGAAPGERLTDEWLQNAAMTVRGGRA